MSPVVPKRVLFLDMDGVMNSGTYMEEFRQTHPDVLAIIDPAAVELLNWIVDETQCSVVLSSTWRLCYPLAEVEQMLRDRGFKHKLDGRTPHMPYAGMVRGNEIYHYLETFGAPVESIAILDDDTDMALLRDRLIRTDNIVGLSRLDAKKCVEMLRTPWAPGLVLKYPFTRS